jgi:serine/threonine protein kinase
MHLDEERLRSYLLGILDDEQAAAAAAHLETCPDCEETARFVESGTADDFVQALRVPWQDDGDDTAMQRFTVRVESLGRSAAAASGAAQAPPEEDESERLGQYRLLEKIGEGGMGVVYKALHERLKRVVALKMLPAADLPRGGALDRFRREMEAVGRLAHPNVVLAHDAGEVDGRHFLVVEYVDGLDLSEALRRVGPWRAADACEAIRQAAIGLQAAHELNLVHRDVKPSNLMLSDGGVVKVLDLGLALLSSQDGDDETDLTAAGQLMGTIDYMAPEQADNSHQVDIRADIYSLGATLYKLLTGQAPLATEAGATVMQKLRAIALNEPQPLTDLRPDAPAPLAAVVHRMLARSPEDRFPTPGAVAEALAPFCTGADLPGLLAAAQAAPLPAPGVSAQGDTLPTTSSSTGDAPRAAAAPPRNTMRLHHRDTRWPRAWAMTAAGLLGVVFLAGVVLIIRDRDGKERARYELAPGDRLEIAEAVADQRQPAGAAKIAVPGGDEAGAVRQELRRRNPEFQGVIAYDVDEGKIVGCKIAGGALPDLSPLAALADLRQLDYEALDPKRDAPVLREMASLETINGYSAATFRLAYPANKPAGGVDAAWLEGVGKLPAETQAEVVIKRLKELNPNFDSRTSKGPSKTGRWSRSVSTWATFSRISHR